MAILVRGKTRCGLCGKPILESDAAVAFLHFVTNEVDPLFRFSDAAFHEECFRQNPLAERCRNAYESSRRCAETELKMCRICGRDIGNPDEYFNTGLLSSDPGSALSEFNNFQAHRSCLKSWSGLRRFHKLLQGAFNACQLRGAAAEALIQELDSLLTHSPTHIG